MTRSEQSIRDKLGDHQDLTEIDGRFGENNWTAFFVSDEGDPTVATAEIIRAQVTEGSLIFYKKEDLDEPDTVMMDGYTPGLVEPRLYAFYPKGVAERHQGNVSGMGKSALAGMVAARWVMDREAEGNR